MNAIEATLTCSVPEAEEVVRQELGKAGFGVLTEIDVAGTLRQKLGVDRPPLKILGACNPALALRALEADPSVSLLLPCNVVLEAAAGGTRVSAADPMSLMPGTDLEEVASEAREKLESVMVHLAEVLGHQQSVVSHSA